MGNLVRQAESYAPKRWSVFVTRLPRDGGSSLFGYRNSDLIHPHLLPPDHPGTPSGQHFSAPSPARSMPVPVNTAHAGPSNVDKSMCSPHP